MVARDMLEFFSGKDAAILFDLRGSQSGALFGAALSGAGDVNADGFGDILIGAPGEPATAGPDTGKAFVWAGAGMILNGMPGKAGQVNQLGVIDATPGEFVLFGYGTDPGSVPVPGCAGIELGMANPILLGSSIVNTAGQAGLGVDVPAQAAGSTVYVQALELGTCTVSNLLVHTFQ